MEDQFYITLNNEQSKKYFPRNSPSRFQVFLDQTINFREYECALLVFLCTTENFESSVKNIYFYFNVCTEQPIGGNRDCLVRSTLVHKGQCQMEKFIYRYNMNVKPMNTSLLEQG